MMRTSLSLRPRAWSRQPKYMARHNFARRHFGYPQLCEMCGTSVKRMYHWAVKEVTKGGRRREDWLRLCVPCHAKYDGRTGRHLSDETKKKIGLKNAISLVGNKNAKGHKLSVEKRREISEKVRLAYKKTTE